jgi:hypothetical protein
VAFHLDGLLELKSTLPRTLLSSNPALLERLFRTAAGFLDEGKWHTWFVLHYVLHFAQHAAHITCQLPSSSRVDHMLAHTWHPQWHCVSATTGSLESRTYGKRIIWAIKLGLSSRSDFDRLVALVQPEALSKKVCLCHGRWGR